MSRARYKKRQDIFVLPDTFYFKYPSLDTVWCSTDRTRLETFSFKAIFVVFREVFNEQLLLLASFMDMSFTQLPRTTLLMHRV